MPYRHILCALLVALLWGTNFTAIKLSYESFTPFFLLFVRFFLSTFPLIFFVPRPKSSWKQIIMISFFLWICQFSFLFVGMYLGAPAGLTSLILQSQTIFTLILSVMFLNYKPHNGEVVGITIAALGIIGIGWVRFTGGSMIGMLTVIPAALSVSVSNVLFSKNATTQKDHPLSMIVWTSFVAIPFMLAASLIFEGPQVIQETFDKLTITSIGSTLYTVYFSTLIATSLWTHLLQQHPPSTVVPYTLLIPVFGMLVANIVLGESYEVQTLLFSTFVLSGLSINQLSRKRIPKMPFRKVS